MIISFMRSMPRNNFMLISTSSIIFQITFFFNSIHLVCHIWLNYIKLCVLLFNITLYVTINIIDIRCRLHNPLKNKTINIIYLFK